MTSNELEIFKQSILDDVRVMMQTTGRVTQYIGARYVPLFADPLEWTNKNEYEPLTIVIHKGNSYTSRQFVPSGIDINNTDFWAITGNYNAQVEQYRKEVATFDERITAAQTTADSKAPINHSTDSTEYGVGNMANYGHLKLTDELSESDANNGIAATPKMVRSVKENMTKRKIMVVVGDSYTAPSYTDATGVWCAPVAQALGVDYKNYAIAGTGFISGTTTTKYSGQLKTAANDPSFNNENVDYVFICGALNDLNYSGTQTQYIEQISNTLSIAKNHFNNAKIILVGPNTWNEFSLDKFSTQEAANMFATAANKFGAGFINTSFMGVGSNHYTNRNHPDAALQLNMASIILHNLFGNSMGTGTSLYEYFSKAPCTTDNEHATATMDLTRLTNGSLLAYFKVTTNSSFVDGSSVTVTFPFNMMVGYYVSPINMAQSTDSVCGTYLNRPTKEANTVKLFNLKKSNSYFLALTISV